MEEKRKQYEQPVKYELSTSETMIMKVIWDAGEDICVPDLTEGLRVRFGKDYKRTSIGTFLSKMADKGFLTTYRVGRLAYVHALRDEEEYRDDLIRRETEFWFDGKLSKMVAAMGDSRGITKEEADKIRSILDDMDD